MTTKNTVTNEQIDLLIRNSEIEASCMFCKVTVVAVKLPNGFSIIESSGCVDPENYNHELGVECCMDRIKDKLWNLEGYRLQCQLYEQGVL